MRILVACHRVPYPPEGGAKVRAFHIIRHLHEAGHEVVVASLARTPGEAVAAAGLRQHCSELLVEVIPGWLAAMRMVARIPTAQPSSFGYFWSPTLARRIVQTHRARPMDLIIAHSSSMGPYVRALGGCPRIMDFCDVDSQKWREYAAQRHLPWSIPYGLEAIKLERQERAQAQQFDLITCATPAEQQSLDALAANARSAWFPNGVDTDYYTPAEEPAVTPTRIAFIGRMDYFPNQQGVQWFCREVWPSLRARWPELGFDIVGAEPPPAIRALQEIPGVRVTGTVDDVRPFVRRAALTVAPLFIARGTQNKVLESMAMGTPVVCSKQVALGVDAVPGEHLLIAEGEAEWKGAIDYLLADVSRRRALAKTGRERVGDKHTWGAAMSRMDALIKPCVRAA